MIIRAKNLSPQAPEGTRVSIRCPSCRQQGIFEPMGTNDIYEQDGRHVLGQRRCPNTACQAHVFFGLLDGRVVVSYPPERIDFDATELPSGVLAALEEAITCHANDCFIAAAIMVRKTLEELCRDQKAGGKNLAERIEGLRSSVVLPQELLAGLHDLRILGNDAAHVESKVYDDVGQEEVEVAIDVAKEVLKAVYQYSALVGKLKALKKPKPSP